MMLAGPARKPNCESVRPKSCLIRSASMPKVTASKKVMKVASTITVSAQ